MGEARDYNRARSQPLRIDDSHIRALLKQELEAIHAAVPDTRIIEELGLLHGSCRADVAVVNGTMHGYELKSDHDTLYRLPEQVYAYSAIFDFVTLVVSERHLLRAIDVIPDWWGIRIARVRHDSLLFRDLRLPTFNPSPDPMSIVMLLWRQEALHLLRHIKRTKIPSSKPRAWIYAELVANASCGYLRDAVRRLLKERADWRSDGIRPSGGD
jgi:hypothetical protein